MKKSKSKTLLNKTVEEKAFVELKHKKEGHSKLMNLKYSKLKMPTERKKNQTLELKIK